MVPSESAPQELSNEWSCQQVSTILNLLGNFCVLPLVREITISPFRTWITNVENALFCTWISHNVLVHCATSPYALKSQGFTSLLKT
jgi:hypothetical protein